MEGSIHVYLKVNPIISGILLSLVQTYKHISIQQDTKIYDHTIALLLQSLADLKATAKEKDTDMKLLVQQVKRYIEQQVKEAPIPLIPEIAAHFNVSSYILWRNFLLHYGASLQHFILTTKMQYAYTLLQNSQLSVLAISLKLGYNEIGNFRTAFKRHFGKTPSAVKKLLKKP